MECAPLATKGYTSPSALYDGKPLNEGLHNPGYENPGFLAFNYGPRPLFNLSATWVYDNNTWGSSDYLTQLPPYLVE